MVLRIILDSYDRALGLGMGLFTKKEGKSSEESVSIFNPNPAVTMKAIPNDFFSMIVGKWDEWTFFSLCFQSLLSI